MNKLIISGNLCKDNDLKFAANSGTAVLRNSVAVRRKFKDQNGQYSSDFIPFVAFGKTAELIANHFEKGQGIQIEARMQSGSYEKDGKKVYTLEAVVESVEFMGGKKGQANNSNNTGFGSNMSFEEDMELVDDGSIPF